MSLMTLEYVSTREAKKVIQRERHITPTIEEIIRDLNGAKVFTKLALKQDYHHQLMLVEESRCIITFSTHI